ncbi:hypothetical protein [Tenacibaculum ovolyticum]|uniref:hypothetical protein n=1 Tax=Tenacibaculum ovolyticum TaxID=104270 RepID=UPI001F2B8F8B|nr:hypothetical protein [Tenacibaculum ovolyticum]
MSNNIYQISNLSRHKYFWSILFKTLVIFFLIITGFIYLNNINDFTKIIKLFLATLFFGWFISFGLPLMLLYNNHSKKSKSVVFEFTNGKFKYCNNIENIVFEKSEIDKIELWLTPPKYDKRIDWQYFGEYHFTKFYLKTGKSFEVSCLVFEETESFFLKEIIIKKKKLFPFLGSVVK